MRVRDFVKRVTSAKRDFLEEFIKILAVQDIDYCVIGGFAVNAYAEPLLGLDLDFVVALPEVNRLHDAFPHDYIVNREKSGITVSAPYSDLRIQIHIDPRYQTFVGRAEVRDVIGYTLRVASPEDILQGKLWAYSDKERQPSKRQQDLADILRLMEANPSLEQTPLGNVVKTITGQL